MTGACRCSATRKQRVRRAGGEDAAASPDDGVPGLRQHAGGAFDVTVGCGVPAVVAGFEQVYVRNLRERFGRYLDLDGPGATGAELAEGFVDGGGYVRRVEHAVGGLGYGADGFLLVVDLVEDAAVEPDEVAVDLAGDDEYGRRCRVRRADGGGGVEQAGAGDDHRRAGAAARAGEPVRHVGGGLLVPDSDEPHARLVKDRVHGVIHLDAGQAEDDLRAFAANGTYEGLSAGHLGHGLAPRPRRHARAAPGGRGGGIIAWSLDGPSRPARHRNCSELMSSSFS